MNSALLCALALLLSACPSKPKRRAPVLPTVQTGDAAAGTSARETRTPATQLSPGVYLVLKDSGNSYQLHPFNHGATVVALTAMHYSQAPTFSPEEQVFGKKKIDFSTNDGKPIALLLELQSAKVKYCLALPLATVLKLPKGTNDVELVQKLQQADAQPHNLSRHKGTLQETDGGWQCASS